MKLEWKDSYKVGQSDIDAQHQHLFELTTLVIEATGDLPALRKALMLLYKHTREHFEHEEALMRSVNFPGTMAHVDYHNSLLSRLNLVSQDVGKGQVNKAAIENLMADWALRHIPHDDAPIAAFLAKRV